MAEAIVFVGAGLPLIKDIPELLRVVPDDFIHLNEPSVDVPQHCIARR